MEYKEIGKVLNDGIHGALEVVEHYDCSRCDADNEECNVDDFKPMMCMARDREDGERIQYKRVEEKKLIEVKAGMNNTYPKGRASLQWNYKNHYIHSGDFSKVRYEDGKGLFLDVRIGDKDIYKSIQEANEILSQYGFVIVEAKEINTFKEFTSFLMDNELRFEPNTNSVCCGIEFGDSNGEEYKAWLEFKDVEKEYNVKLNIIEDTNNGE